MRICRLVNGALNGSVQGKNHKPIGRRGILDTIAMQHPDPVEAESPKRRAILDAARGLFMTEGYGAVSMDAVARSAGVSKATLYAHCGAKDRLFAAIIHEACETMRRTSGVEGALADLPLREALHA